MSVTPPAVVLGAPRAPLPFGLFSVVGLRESSADRWEGGGVVFETLGCPPTGGIIGAAQCEPDETVGLPKTFDGGLSLEEAHPFTVYGSYVCSPIGNDINRAQEVAQQRLLATEEIQVEARLWALTGVEPTALPEGLSTATVVDTTGNISHAIGALEGAIASGYGAVGVIHLSRRNALLAVEKGALEVRNGRLQTVLGTPAVAGAGYGDEKIVATPAIFGYRSEVFTSMNADSSLLDRETNDLHGIAERSYLLGFDGCGPWAVDYTPGSDGGSEVDQEARNMIDALSQTVDDKADQTALDALTQTVAGKADASHTHAAGDIDSGTLATARIPNLAVSKVTGLQAALDSKGQVESVSAGTGIDVDTTDPANPTISTL